MIRGESTISIINVISSNRENKFEFSFPKHLIPGKNIYHKWCCKINFLLHQVFFCHTILLHYYYNYNRTLTIRATKYPIVSLSETIG